MRDFLSTLVTSFDTLAGLFPLISPQGRRPGDKANPGLVGILTCGESSFESGLELQSTVIEASKSSPVCTTGVCIILATLKRPSFLHNICLRLHSCCTKINFHIWKFIQPALQGLCNSCIIIIGTPHHEADGDGCWSGVRRGSLQGRVRSGQV